ncbi:MAG: hypothetical protein V5B32_04910 [Candidatus Accumulibacter sp. UW26]|jgi:hypothetical protein
MGHLLKDSAPLELYAWQADDCALPGGDILLGNPFGEAHPGEPFTAVQNYFAEYHLEYFRQRLYPHFPSRLHARLLFATRVDADTFCSRHPARVPGRRLFRMRSEGAYVCSFHDSTWLDYLRLPHSLNLSRLDELADHYWQGALAEEVALTFLDQPWRQPPVIEALFQGTLKTASPTTRRASGDLPGLA